MEASGWLLEARTTEVENQKEERRVRGEKRRFKGGKRLKALNRPTVQRPLCHIVVQRQLASKGWLVSGGPLWRRWCYVCRWKAGLLCAEPLHVHQRPAGGPLDIISWPSRPPPCLLFPLGG